MKSENCIASFFQLNRTKGTLGRLLQITFLLLKKEVWIERPNLVNMERKAKRMTPVLGITYSQWQEVASDFRTISRELINSNVTQSELGGPLEKRLLPKG